MAFEQTQAMIAKLPNWAKVALVGGAAVLAYILIKKRSSASSSTTGLDATGAAGGIYNVELPAGGVSGGGGGGGTSSNPAAPVATPPTDTGSTGTLTNPLPSNPITPVQPTTVPTASRGWTPAELYAHGYNTAPVPQAVLPMEQYGAIGVQGIAPYLGDHTGLRPSGFYAGGQSGVNSIPPYR
jgi:hypothetical protein